jgi:hypothetical protein
VQAGAEECSVFFIFLQFFIFFFKKQIPTTTTKEKIGFKGLASAASVQIEFVGF